MTFGDYIKALKKGSEAGAQNVFTADLLEASTNVSLDDEYQNSIATIDRWLNGNNKGYQKWLKKHPIIEDNFIQYVTSLYHEKWKIVKQAFENFVTNDGFVIDMSTTDDKKFWLSVLGQLNQIAGLPYMLEYKTNSSRFDGNINKHIYNYYINTVRKESDRLRSFEDPEKRKHLFNINIEYRDDFKKSFTDVVNIISSTPENVRLIYLEERGGSGKTHAMLLAYYEMLTKYRKNAVFITSRTLKVYDECINPISRLLHCEVLCDNKCPDNCQDGQYVDCIGKLDFIDDNELYLFIDGINEVGVSVREKIEREVARLLIQTNGSKNLKVIISSRLNCERKLYDEYTGRKETVSIKPLSDKEIKKHIADETYNNLSDDMKTILKLPLMLSLYLNTPMSTVDFVNKSGDSFERIKPHKCELKQC